MKKRVLGTLVVFTLSINLFSVSTFAATKDINALYKEAYDATNTCLKVRTQQSVKNARQAISRLPKNIKWAIGEFSKQVDSVQQPIFVKLLNSLSKAKNTKKQADINATKEMINDVIETQYKRTWSSELDKVQQGKMNRLVTLVNKVENGNFTSETIKTIKYQAEDIKIVKYNEQVKNWINNYSKKINEVLKLNDNWIMQSRNSKNLRGIDVSNWKGNIDFKKVKDNGVKVVYMKATESNNFKDKYLEQNYKGAMKNGLKVGFYHFFRGKGIEEARYFYNAIKDKPCHCRLALDVETSNGMSKNELTNQCLMFLEELKRLSGRDVVVYTCTNVALNNLDSRLAQYPLWIAHYGVDTPGENYIWKGWVGFQYSDKGKVPGVNGACDLDEFTPEIFIN